ncbi:MAG: hypothetical protein ACR2MP_24350, partial [Streptosporangiaceae bacterium]
MLLKIVYLLVRRLLSLAVLVLRMDLAKDAELFVLRHENAVLRRHVGRVRYEPARSGVVGRASAVHTPQALDRCLSRDASDAAGLASQIDREEVRHEQAAQARAPTDGP